MGRKTPRRIRPIQRTIRSRPAQFVQDASQRGPSIGTYIAPPIREPGPLSVIYGFARGRQLEGTFPGLPEMGVWPISHFRIAYGWGSVLSKDWPDSKNAPWPPVEPPGIDDVAKKMRLGPYQRVRGLEDCKRAMAASHPPLTYFQITEDWFDAEHGVIPEPRSDDRFIGSHGVMIVGYDDFSKRVTFDNSSWGPDWGADGTGTISYSYFRQRAIETWVQSPTSLYAMRSKKAIEDAPQCGAVEGVYELAWETWDVVRGGVLHVVEIYDPASDERIGWAFAVSRDGFLDIEEIFVRPGYRRRGYSRRLATLVLKTSEALGLPIRLWVSYADCTEENRAALSGLLKSLGLSLWNSPTKWAAYVGLADSSPHRVEEPTLPDRPALNREAWRKASVTILAASLSAGLPESTPVMKAVPHAAVALPNPVALGDPPTNPALGQDHDEGDDLMDAGYDMVMTAPPREVIACSVRVEEIVKGREDLPMMDSDWEDLLLEENEDSE